MAYDYKGMRRVAVDPRILAEVQRSPKMVSEQGGGWMAGWGGPSMYQVLAKLPMRERLVYAAVLEGYTTPVEIEDVTELTSKEVGVGLSGLQSKGLVEGENGLVGKEPIL